MVIACSVLYHFYLPAKQFTSLYLQSNSSSNMNVEISIQNPFNSNKQRTIFAQLNLFERWGEMIWEEINDEYEPYPNRRKVQSDKPFYYTGHKLYSFWLDKFTLLFSINNYIRLWIHNTLPLLLLILFALLFGSLLLLLLLLLCELVCSLFNNFLYDNAAKNML